MPMDKRTHDLHDLLWARDCLSRKLGKCYNDPDAEWQNLSPSQWELLDAMKHIMTAVCDSGFSATHNS